jgi:cell wall-associated NlpC family hydrolase
MQAWAAGGKSLPHYSVAQYQQSSPVSLSQLQPGDLLFWGDGGPTSIYHVAIYTGNGMMIHAPRPGRSVEEVSMYYWTTPNYFARP